MSVEITLTMTSLISQLIILKPWEYPYAPPQKPTHKDMPCEYAPLLSYVGCFQGYDSMLRYRADMLLCQYHQSKCLKSMKCIVKIITQRHFCWKKQTPFPSVNQLLDQICFTQYFKDGLKQKYWGKHARECVYFSCKKAPIRLPQSNIQKNTLFWIELFTLFLVENTGPLHPCPSVNGVQ